MFFSTTSPSPDHHQELQNVTNLNNLYDVSLIYSVLKLNFCLKNVLLPTTVKPYRLYFCCK